MSRRMSCSMTIDAVRDRSKTVTRRHVDTWKTIKPGDRLTLIEKGMGLPKGAKQVVLAEVEVVDVSVEPLAALTVGEVRREGFNPSDFGFPATVALTAWAQWWARGHGYRNVENVTRIECRRIEWRYLDEEVAS